jgi:hypothetical protein
MLALGVAGALCAGGCLHSRVDAEWGEAQEDDAAAQIAHPDGVGSPDAPAGLDPVTAGEVANRYYKDQALQPPRAPAPVLQESH